MNNKREHYDVIIVGAGLVGASLAALLGEKLSASAISNSSTKKPLSIALIDAAEEPSASDVSVSPPVFDPRVVALTHASQQLFESLDVWQDIIAQRACSYTDMHVWDDDGTASIHFNAKEIQQASLGHIVENNILLSAVLNKIKQQDNITCIRGIKVNAFTQTDDGASITLSDDTTLSATLVVAADGGQSKMRELVNIATREWDYQHKAIVATIKSEHSHQHTAWQNFLSTGPLAFLPLSVSKEQDHSEINSPEISSSEKYCSIVWSVETDKADELMALDDELFCEALGKAFEHRLGVVESTSRRFSFPLKQRYAIEYSNQGVVLIGDAAHTIHPLAGQGVNLGLLDAQALAGEINRALDRGLAINEPSVLRRYQRQRKGHNIEVMLLMESFKRLFGSRNIMVRWLRNAGMKKVNELALLKNWLAKQAIKSKQ